ncbi:MAG: hypoxanthine phosphoribosyltransferase [Candidatus Cyclobacteriaceae bacterium M2_1C_046]
MQLHGKTFHPFISSSDIDHRIQQIGEQINEEYSQKKPLFIAVLNGAFMFAADLMKQVKIDCEISFIKVSSYEDMHSTGNIKQLIGLNENILGRDIIIIEDIVDSGRTIAKIMEEFKDLGAQSIEVVTLLRKPSSKNINTPIKYIGFDIPDQFVVGYGLDYDGLGRNFADIYQYID